MAFGKALVHRLQVQVEVAKFPIGRAGRMHGVEVVGSMGLTTWAAFSGSDDLAAVDGDFHHHGRRSAPDPADSA